ncbi:MAG: DUF2889 domain-containing protein [Desulfosporosinus sp.]|nr:DUF2889 domain-containing protein [Desulfosporosinus sp.]
MYLFNRSISVNVRSIDNKAVTIEGTLLDSYHELYLNLEVNLESNTITSAAGELRRVPYNDCKKTQVQIQNLVGINLALNVRKQIQAAVGLDCGCTHLTDLTLECLKCLANYKENSPKLLSEET